MTSATSIITPHATSGVTNGQKSPAAQAPAHAGGVMGFLTVLLNNVGGQASGQTADATDALAAKISALLEKTGGSVDAATLEQILPPGLAKTVADQLAALQSLLPSSQPVPTPTLLGDAAAPTLNSDLSSAGATTAQDETLLQTLATELNALEPGSEATAAGTDDAAQQIVDVKDDMMATLLALQDGERAESLMAVKAPAGQQSEATSSPLRAQATAMAGEPMTAETAKTLPGNAAPVADANAGKQTPVATTATAATTASAPAPVQTQPAPIQVQLNTQPSLGMLGSSLGALNSLLSGGMNGGGFDQGFGGQSGFSADAALLNGADATRISAGNASFTTYMNAAAKASGQSATAQMVGIQISRNANAKIDTFTMQLEPADLGALEVRMSFSKDGKISAKLIADRPETLSLLQRDSSQLERILQQSGLDVAENALSFDLRDQNQQSLYDGSGARDDGSIYAGRGDHAHKNSSDIVAQLAIENAGYISQTGVNIMV